MDQMADDHQTEIHTLVLNLIAPTLTVKLWGCLTTNISSQENDLVSFRSANLSREPG